ncbi:MAG TPA: hypothetical protein VEA16_14565 [Vicinamibacterales bacterium]|nr:hypothetical protein [Vicinamibacterales bacterium]
MQDLGTLGNDSYGTGVNTSGTAVGFSDHADGRLRGFIWTASAGMQEIGTLGWHTVPLGISDTGVVFGYWYPTVGSSSYRPLRCTAADCMQDLGTLGGNYAVASAMKNAGRIIGSSSLPGDRVTHGFFWPASTAMVDIGTGGDYAGPRAINDSGVVVGSGSTTGNQQTHAFQWTQSGGMQDLGTLVGNYSEATAINVSGQVTGQSYDASNQLKAFLYTPGGIMVAIPAPFSLARRTRPGGPAISRNAVLGHFATTCPAPSRKRKGTGFDHDGFSTIRVRTHDSESRFRRP